MKTLLLVLCAAGLTGCAVYPAPAYESYGYGEYGNAAGPPLVVAPQPVYIYGGGVYRSGAYPYAYPRRYVGPPPPRGFAPHVPRPGHGVRDRDRDRDGDGARNRNDRWPDHPNRR